jgi:hypothetical protein
MDGDIEKTPNTMLLHRLTSLFSIAYGKNTPTPYSKHQVSMWDYLKGKWEIVK